MITIIDYGAGNIKSIQNMLGKLGAESCISNTASEIKHADKLILPGVGHYDHGMKSLKNSGLIEVLNDKVQGEKVPLLGICLGAQLLGNGSEEGDESGLGWIDMEVVRFDDSKMETHLKIPHMSWNTVIPQKDSILISNSLAENSRFYFVHTYHMLPKQISDILSVTKYGYEFVSGVERNNILGVQFHPEKSHVFGMNLLKNFVDLF